eukprot:747759-Hanusia_phi.AAC.2
MEFDDQPSFRDLALSETELQSSSAEVDFTTLRDISKRFREELKLQNECNADNECLTSEEGRNKKFGCPSRSKQLQALEHAMTLIADRNRQQIISATGEELVL